MANDRQELEELRRLDELEQKAAGTAPSEKAPEKSTGQYIKDAGSGLLKGAGFALGLAGSNVRNAVAQTLQHKLKNLAGTAGAMGAPVSADDIHFAEDGDWGRALKAQAPGVSEYLERAGVPALGSASDVIPGYAEKGKGRFLHPEKGGMLDPSVRGAVGAVGDAALDPLTYLSGGLSAAKKTGVADELLQKLLLANEQGLTKGGRIANNVLNPLEMLSRKGGKAAYNGTFNQVDAAVGKIQESPQTVGELARRYGFVGNAQQAADFVTRTNAKAGEVIDSILNEASEKGARVNLDEPFALAKAQADALRKTGHLENQAVADMIEKRLEALKASHGSDVANWELNAPKQRVERANADLPLEDPYHSVELDRNRVVTTETPRLHANGEPVLSNKPVQIAGASTEMPTLEMQNRKKSSYALEMDPKEGQAAFPFPVESSQEAPTLTKVVTKDRRIPVNEANKLKSMMNDDAKFKLTSNDTQSSNSIKAITKPLSKAVPEAVGSVDQALKEKLLEQNGLYRSTNDDVQYLMDSWAGRTPQLRNPVTPTKVDLLALGVKPEATLLKKIGDMVLSTRGRTSTGYMLDKFGNKSNGVADALLREYMLRNSTAKEDEK